jgi:quinol monooxygenase YgiN
MSVMVAAGRAAALRSRLLEIPELSPKLRDLLKAAPERADQAQAAAKTRRGAEADQAKEESKLPNPPGRRLQVYAVDPSYAASIETSPYNRVTVNVRWEAVKPGPVGEYLEVVDIDPASGAAYPPIDLNDARLLARDGLAPSEGDPRFHQQMVYAVAMKTIKHFERALGRPAFWATEPYQDETGRWQPEPFNPRLRIYPHALRTQNAYYSPDKRALLFGYFPSPSLDGASGTPGPTVFTCLSYDIIAHETTHALLDGMYTHFIKPTNADVLAFHEAFADIVALFQHFTHPELLRAAIEQTRGDLEAESQLGKLAVQFGHATGQRGALRDAIGHITEDGKWVRHKPRADLLRTDR